MGMYAGKALENGSVVVDFKVTRSNTDIEGNRALDGVLLAVKTGEQADPYVVWRFQDFGGSTTCYGGWYYDGLRAAISHFEDRSGYR